MMQPLSNHRHASETGMNAITASRADYARAFSLEHTGISHPKATSGRMSRIILRSGALAARVQRGNRRKAKGRSLL